MRILVLTLPAVLSGENAY